MLKRFFLVLISSCFLYSLTQATVVQIKSKDELKSIGKEVFCLIDNNKNYNLDSVFKNDHLFKKNKSEVFANPAKDVAIWFKFEIENDTDEDLWLGLGGAFSAWYIDVYKSDSAKNQFECLKSGALREHVNKEYPVNFFWFKLANKTEKKPKTFYVRYESEQPIEIPFRIGTLFAFTKYKQAHDYMTAIFLGVMIGMFLYNLFLYFSTKDINYIYYVGLLVFSVLSVLFDNNALLLDYPWIYKHYIVWHNLVFIFVYLFSVTNLEINKFLPKTNLFLLAIMILISVIFPIANLLGLRHIYIINPLQIFISIYYLTLLTTGILLWKKGSQNAKYYVIGWSFSFISIGVFILVINGVLPYTLVSRNMMYFGLCIETVLFSFVLGNRMNTMRYEKEKALYDLITIQKTSLKEALESENKIIKLYKDLSTSYKNLEQFSFIVSHNLRSPLTNIKGLLSIYNYDNLADPENVDLLNHMKTATSNLDQVLQDLNIILNSKNLILEEKNEINFGVFFDAICDSLRNEIISTKTTFELDFEPNLKIITVRSILQSIVFNLIQNAIKYKNSARNPHIIIKIRENSEGYSFWIRDNGIGIDLDRHKEKVFSLYARFHTKTQGKGIGLYLVKTHVEMLGGSIEVESEVNQYTEFHFDIKK